MSFFFGEKYDTIIVGGGIAGLFLAYKLKDTKQDILLLEKEGEWGGRIHTMYKTDYHYECGPARISNKHHKLISLIQELDLLDQLIKLPDDIDVIIHNKRSSININSLLKELIVDKYTDEQIIELIADEKGDKIANQVRAMLPQLRQKLQPGTSVIDKTRTGNQKDPNITGLVQ